MDFLSLVGDVGFPIAGSLAAGGFVFLTLKFILLRGTFLRLDLQVRHLKRLVVERLDLLRL